MIGSEDPIKIQQATKSTTKATKPITISAVFGSPALTIKSLYSIS